MLAVVSVFGWDTTLHCSGPLPKTLALLLKDEISQSLYLEGTKRHPLISLGDINARETLLMANRGVLWMNQFDFWRNFLKYSVSADLHERSGSTNQVAIINPES